jgi:protein-L-isoaspartate(D-aspartate) O-methyltransferase
VGDGYVGWPEAAPFDVVVVTAAPERVPQPLLDSSRSAALDHPVGAAGDVQQLELYR